MAEKGCSAAFGPSALITLVQSAVASLVFAACGSGPSPEPDPSAEDSFFDVAINALDLEGVGFACYDVEVLSVTSVSPVVTTETVWRRGDFWTNRADDNGNFAGDADTLCSNVFGNGEGGDVSYVGTCDATYSQHVVRVVLDGLYKPSGARLPEGEDWSNPCPPAEPCEVYADCKANTDTPVELNMMIARSANQGFFDIGVRFDEIFCSAKVDCAYTTGVDPEGTPIQEPILLVHGADGEPQNTAVIGFACTAGPGDVDLTELYMNAPRVECGGGALGGENMSQFMCHPGADAPELVGFNWFRIGSKSQSGFNMVFQTAESQQWLSDGDSGWVTGDTLPTFDATFGETYDLTAPMVSLDADRILVYAVTFGTTSLPVSMGGDLAGIETLRIGVISRSGGTTWDTLEVLPGLDAEVLAFDYLLDPTSGYLVVRAVRDDGMGYVTYTVHVFEPDAGASTGFSVFQPPSTIPPGVSWQLESFVNKSMVVRIGPDWNAPAPVSISDGYYLAHLDGAGAQYDMASLTGPIDYTDASGEVWTLNTLGNGNAPTVLTDRVFLSDGYWTNPNPMYDGATNFPLILTLVETSPGVYALEPQLVPIDPSQGALKPFPAPKGYVDYQTARGFRWYGTEAAGSQRNYMTVMTKSSTPYMQTWQTWVVPDWMGTTFYVDSLIEGIPGARHLVIGRSSSQWTQLQTAEPCDPMDPYAYCGNPPPNNGWGVSCVEDPPSSGTYGCLYGYNTPEEFVLGYLGASDTDVTWTQALPKPADASSLSTQDVRETDAGRELLFSYGGNNNSGQFALRIEESRSTVSDISVLQPGVFNEARARNYDNGNDWRYQFDSRTRVRPDTCQRVYAGAGRLDTPPTWPEYVDGGAGAVWSLDGPSTPLADPAGSFGFDATALAPSQAFLDAIDAGLAGLGSGQSYYELPLDIPEGYAWDLENNPPDPGVVFQYGVYYGEEELMCSGEPCNKKYFNVAIGIDPSYTNCMLAFEATAAKPGVISGANGWTTPPGAVYPVVVARVNLTPDIAFGSDGVDGVCGANPLNGGKSGVQTMYTHSTDGEGFPFCYHLDLDGETVHAHCADDYDYSDIDANPIFGSSKVIDPRGPRAEAAEATRALTLEGVGVGIGQFEAAYPDCETGLTYDPDRFGCFGDCGDGVRTVDEACDDGNTRSGDGCSAACRVEVTCGDGTSVIAAEQLCDGHADCPGDAVAWDERPGYCLYCDAGAEPLPPSSRCDGIRDCRDGRDEARCPNAAE